MEWVIESYDRRTDRDGEHTFTTEAAEPAGRARRSTRRICLACGLSLRSPIRGADRSDPRIFYDPTSEIKHQNYQILTSRR
jgi:hypothetical protein